MPLALKDSILNLRFMKLFSVLFSIFFFCVAAKSQSVSQDHSVASSMDVNKYYPFELKEINGHHLIVAQLKESNIYPKYFKFFKKYGYEGNGPCWKVTLYKFLKNSTRI